MILNMAKLIFLSLVYIFLLVHAKRTLPSQFEATCYRGCKCTKSEVSCNNLNEKTPNLFQKYVPQIYPELSTLIVTGNDFGPLPDEDLFGSNFRHEQLSLVNMTNNGITYFGVQTFIGMPRVEYFYLSNNKLDSVGEKPLTYLTSLKRFDINNVFGTHVSSDHRADIIRQIFQANHTFNDLNEISLKDNLLHYLHKDTFCNVLGLDQLILANNGLKSFDLDPKCLKSLIRLDLSNNRITTIPQMIYAELSLRDLDISKNPLKCDCKLQPFIEYATDRSTSFLNQDNSYCASPASLEGKRIFEMENLNLCHTGSTFFHWVILILIGAGFLLGYRWFRRHGRPFRIPFTVGYSPLKSENEGPQPTFV